MMQGENMKAGLFLKLLIFYFIIFAGCKNKSRDINPDMIPVSDGMIAVSSPSWSSPAKFQNAPQPENAPQEAVQEKIYEVKVAKMQKKTLYEKVRVSGYIQIQKEKNQAQGPNKAILDASISMEDVPKIRTGQLVSAKSALFPGKDFWGKTLETYGIPDPLTGKVKVRIEVSDDSGSLRSGMPLDAEITTQVRNDAAVINKAAILDTPDGKYIIGVASDTARVIRVDVGVEQDDLIEIRSKVKEGASIIIEGGDLGLDNKKVKVIQ